MPERRNLRIEEGRIDAEPCRHEADDVELRRLLHDPQREPRLRQLDLPPVALEVSLLGDGHEVPQMTELHR